MNFKDHLRFGVVGGIVTAAASGFVTQKPEEVAIIFGLTVAGSLFPDLDTASIPSRITAFILTITGLLCIYYRELYPVVYFMWAFCFVKSFKHRGFSHSWFIPAALIGLTLYLELLWFAAFGIGCIIHLVVDKIYPWKVKNWFAFSLPKLL